MAVNEDSLIHDWNLAEGAAAPARVDVDDETLRDGLQSPSVREPDLDTKIAILEGMVACGLRRGDIGLPMSSQRADIEGMLAHIVAARLPFAPGLAVRTVESDLQHVVDLQQKFGIPILAEAFLGCSRIRQYVEGWDLDWLLRQAEAAVRFAVRHDVRILFVTEDTTRAHPTDLEALYGAAVDAGAQEVCIADTVGHATPSGARAIVRKLRSILAARGRQDVLVHWHGHSDRGLAIPNSLAAAEAGADVVHGSGLGIGERSGNTPIDLLLVNLKLMGLWEHDLSALAAYVDRVSAAVDVPIPVNYPVFGRDAFRTATGVHAAAIVKALDGAHPDLADVVYSGVNATLFGRRQEIEIGRMSGRSNVVYWLRNRGHAAPPAVVEAVLEAAREARTVLDDDAIEAIVRRAASA